jgi:hypothetical protein
MGRPKLIPLPAEVEETRARLHAWRRTRKNGDHLPEKLWSEAAGLARRLGVNRVCRALGLNHTTLKEHVAKGQVATSPVKRQGAEPAQPAFVELDGGRFLGDLPAGPVLEVTRPEGERMVMRWPVGSVVDTCGLVASFIGRH